MLFKYKISWFLLILICSYFRFSSSLSFCWPCSPWPPLSQLRSSWRIAHRWSQLPEPTLRTPQLLPPGNSTVPRPITRPPIPRQSPTLPTLPTHMSFKWWPNKSRVIKSLLFGNYSRIQNGKDKKKKKERKELSDEYLKYVFNRFKNIKRKSSEPKNVFDEPKLSKYSSSPNAISNFKRFYLAILTLTYFYEFTWTVWRF